MARKSKADRVNEILKSNPLLKMDDSRINDLIEAEAQLRKAQRAARNSEVIASSAAGSAKRHPALVALEVADKSVRRLRNELQIDRLGVKRNENAGVKVKRSSKFDEILAALGTDGPDPSIPAEAAFMAAHGIVAEDLPEAHQEWFRTDLEKHIHLVDGIRARLKQYNMW
jgi:hypothetical protein